MADSPAKPSFEDCPVEKIVFVGNWDSDGKKVAKFVYSEKWDEIVRDGIEAHRHSSFRGFDDQITFDAKKFPWSMLNTGSMYELKIDRATGTYYPGSLKWLANPFDDMKGISVQLATESRARMKVMEAEGRSKKESKRDPMYEALDPIRRAIGAAPASRRAQMIADVVYYLTK